LDARRNISLFHHLTLELRGNKGVLLPEIALILIEFYRGSERERIMTEYIDTVLLKSGMEARELCAITHRRMLYTGIAVFATATVLSIALVIFAPLQG
jgi:hypothetical protein